MPIGDGWHPFLKLNQKIDNLFLKFDSAKKILTDQDMIPTGKKIKFDDFKIFRQINNTVFDTCFLLCSENNKHQTELYDEKNDLKITLWQETGKGKYNYLQIYTPPDRKSIAIEPMTCNINSFNNKDGLIILQPHEKFVGSYGINLS